MRGLIPIVLVVGFVLFFGTERRAVDGSRWAEGQTQAVIGELRALQVASGALRDTTTLELDDGTRIEVRGRYPRVRLGMPVTTPQSVPPATSAWSRDRFFCLAEACLPVVRH